MNTRQRRKAPSRQAARTVPWLLAVLASAALAAAVAAAPGAPCPSGWTRATVGGKQTCLRVGQMCRRAFDHQYHRYGFHCHGARLTRPARQADLMVSLEASPNPASLGYVTLTARVSNLGSAPATNGSLAVAAQGAVASEASAPAPASCVVEPPARVLCRLGSLPPGGRILVTIRLRPAAAGALVATAAASSEAREANRANDRAETAIPVLPGDSVRGTGMRSAFNGGAYRFTVDAWSGPRGERPEGTFRVELERPPDVLFAVGRVVCLAVAGGRAAVGGVVDETNDAAGFGRGLIFFVDDGGGAAPDASISLLHVDDPAACGLRPDLPRLPLLEGDFAVVDAP